MVIALPCCALQAQLTLDTTMDRIEVTRRLIERTQRDFLSYYLRTPHRQLADRLMSYALALDQALIEPAYLKTATLSLQTALAMDGLLPPP